MCSNALFLSCFAISVSAYKWNGIPRKKRVYADFRFSWPATVPIFQSYRFHEAVKATYAFLAMHAVYLFSNTLFQLKKTEILENLFRIPFCNIFRQYGAQNSAYADIKNPKSKIDMRFSYFGRQIWGISTKYCLYMQVYVPVGFLNPLLWLKMDNLVWDSLPSCLTLD